MGMTPTQKADTTISEERLKPCPFCGGEAMPHLESGRDERSGYNFNASVLCKRCNAKIYVSSHHDANGWCTESEDAAMARAVEAWNRRSQGNATPNKDGRIDE